MIGILERFQAKCEAVRRPGSAPMNKSRPASDSTESEIGLDWNLGILPAARFTMIGFRFFALGAVLALAPLPLAAQSGAPELSTGRTPQVEAHGRKTMVVTAEPF